MIKTFKINPEVSDEAIAEELDKEIGDNGFFYNKNGGPGARRNNRSSLSVSDPPEGFPPSSFRPKASKS